MEEEIPQGLILLRSISRSSFRATYPGLSYARFIISCLLRLIMGYLFLLNLFITIVQAGEIKQNQCFYSWIAELIDAISS